MLGLAVAGTGAAAADELPGSSTSNSDNSDNVTAESVISSLENWYDNTDVVGSLTSVVGSALTGGSTAGSWMYLLPSTGQ